MDLPPQPPADVPAPPVGPEAIPSRRVMRRIIVAGILSIIGLLLLPLFAQAMRRARRPDSDEARNNAKNLHLDLLNFESDYGNFPGSSTVAAVKAHTGTSLTLGDASSNEVFRQLLATAATSESTFWAASAITPRKPDNDSMGSHALEKGECAFAYVAGLSSANDQETPILMAPVIPSKRCFERRKAYNYMAVVLFIDGRVLSLPVDKRGQVMLNGMDLFDPRQLFWKGKTPDIKWPE